MVGFMCSLHHATSQMPHTAPLGGSTLSAAIMEDIS